MNSHAEVFITIRVPVSEADRLAAADVSAPGQTWFPLVAGRKADDVEEALAGGKPLRGAYVVGTEWR